jgi:hypothetical protein
MGDVRGFPWHQIPRLQESRGGTALSRGFHTGCPENIKQSALYTDLLRGTVPREFRLQVFATGIVDTGNTGGAP